MCLVFWAVSVFCNTHSAPAGGANRKLSQAAFFLFLQEQNPSPIIALQSIHTLRGSMPGADDGLDAPRPGGGPWSNPLTALQDKEEKIVLC